MRKLKINKALDLKSAYQLLIFEGILMRGKMREIKKPAFAGSLKIIYFFDLIISLYPSF